MLGQKRLLCVILSIFFVAHIVLSIPGAVLATLVGRLIQTGIQSAAAAARQRAQVEAEGVLPEAPHPPPSPPRPREAYQGVIGGMGGKMKILESPLPQIHHDKDY
jgi:hypothetical protein